MDFSIPDKEEFARQLIEFRRDLHQHPENAWTEYRTTSKIIHTLESLGIRYCYGPSIHTKGERFGVPDSGYMEKARARAIEEGADAALVAHMGDGYTGVVGILDTGRPGPVTALRFDIDCNDVSESDDPEHFPAANGFASIHPDLMHACGHDAHTAIGIGVANLLVNCMDHLCGTIKLVFQAAEEGARGGASIADSGIVSDADYLFGGHIGGSGWSVGENAASTQGFATSYKVDLMFEGVSSHAGGYPEKGRNALAAGAVTVINTMAISRHSEGRTRANIGTMQAGTGRNVIADRALLKAEVRGDSDELNEYMYERMLCIGQAAAEMYGCRFSHRIMGHSVNAPMDDALIDVALAAANETEGMTRMERVAQMTGGGEDVTFLMRAAQRHGGKATFLWLGADTCAPHHNSRFSFDEGVIPLTARLFATMIFKLNGLDIK